MTPIPRDAPASIACGRSGRPLLAVCGNGHRRLVPFRLLATFDGDRSPLYGRRFRCRSCGSGAATLFSVDSQAELEALRVEIGAGDPGMATAPTNASRHDPDDDLP